MGTQVHCEGYLPSYYSMRDLNEDSNSSGWPLFYGDKTLPNGQYCNGFTSRTITDAYPGYDKDALKQKMLEHEAIFKNQVMELHRLYQIQRDMMDEIRRKELDKHRSSVEPSCSSSHIGSHVPSEDARKWHITNFPMENSSYSRPSTSGTEIANSPFSSSKGNGVQFGQMQNGYSPKISDVLEARPSKVRKKLFDLQIPADEYFDTEEDEQLRDNAGSSLSSYPVNGSCVNAQESGSKLFPGGYGGKSDNRKNVPTSISCVRSSIGLADLNEPAQVEEAIPPPVDFLGYANNLKGTSSINASVISNPPFVALPTKNAWNSSYASPSDSLCSLNVDNKGKERELFILAHDKGSNIGSSASLPRSLEQDKMPVASHAQVMINKDFQSPGIHAIHHIKDDIRNDRTRHSVNTQKNAERSNFSHVEPFVTSKMASPYPCASSSEFNGSWSRSVSSWEKPNGSFAQRLSSMPTNSFFNSSSAVGKGSQLSQSQMGDNWHGNGSYRLHPGFASEQPVRGGFQHGSASGTKESPIYIPSTTFDSPSHIKGDRYISERSSNNACENFLRSSSNKNVASGRGFNLNLLSESAPDEEIPRQNVEFDNVKREPKDTITVLPWLKAKANGHIDGTDTRIGGTSSNSGFVHPYSNPHISQSDTVKCSNEFCQTQNVASALEDQHLKTRKEVGETRPVRKILGVPILDFPPASRNESSSLVSSSATLRSSPQRESIRSERRNMVIDINVAYDHSSVEPEKPSAVQPVLTEEVETKTSNVRNHFDLNSCFTEDEEPVSAECHKAKEKIILDIDLEAPVVMNFEEDFPGEEEKQQEAALQLPDQKPEHLKEELDRIAAEAIVSISSTTDCIVIEETTNDPSDDPLDSLRWFVDVVSSCAAELESKENTGKCNVMVARRASMDLDYFEAMTLQLVETKEEDYMPMPFVPEIQIIEDAGAGSLTSRPRRGNARRGRQRRDFQRDILPGLASLSRHEVTEDLQTFGGLMRATGHTWNGLTRRNGTRNGGARGRRKAVVDTTPAPVLTTTSSPLIHQLNNIEASLEDKSLTGWGKTPRRPRRQRCPAGNPPPAATVLT